MVKGKWIFILLLGGLAVFLFMGISGVTLPKTFRGQVVSVGNGYFTVQSEAEGSYAQIVVVSWPDEPVEEGEEVTVKYHRAKNTSPISVYADAVVRETDSAKNRQSSENQPENVQQSAALPKQTAEESFEALTQEGAGKDEQEEIYFQRDGKDYQKVPDLNDGMYYWASAVTRGEMVRDKDGCEYVDYEAQSRSFERLNGNEKIEVRRWDNLYYSAGDYLIYEYNGTMHISDFRDLYHPVLSYDVAGTYGIITKIPDGYMVANEQDYTVAFYDMDFRLKDRVEGYRAELEGEYYRDGLMAVRDMKTGLMGFMDQAGNLRIPCIYGLVSSFANGYASVLTGAEMAPYTEDGGTVAMFNAQGGRWGIIDTDGAFAIEPSEKYENPPSEYYGGARRFSEVRKDKTVDFLDVENDVVLSTLQIE